ncbi:MAG TPA: group I intron-associated PD-(D/E)XK endonuclease [Candidatus Sulfotelmatobacter sp.]|jgi:hypothetical protein|nr:group I intron-associated PD-(D/E)XK endonuclease [Candidatus Sulfotelmatobacter sp.]
MKYWERFTNSKQRGEWVELQIMAQAALRRFNVCRPWADMLAYDVGIEYGEHFLRVQVKSTTQRLGAGYRCQIRPKHRKAQPYTLSHLDLFAAYVIPEDAWYLIPAAVVLQAGRINDVILCPSSLQRRKPATATNATASRGTC